MTTNSQQRKGLLWFGSGAPPCTSQPRPGSVSNPWLPVDHMGERDPFLEWGVCCTGLWAEQIPQKMFTCEREQCSDKYKRQPIAAPSSGVAGWAGWNFTVKSRPQAGQQHLIGIQGEQWPKAKPLEFLHTLSFISQVCSLICLRSFPITSVPSSETYSDPASPLELLFL